FRRGAIRGLIDTLERTPENRNVAQNFINSTAVRDKVGLIFGDQKAAQEFLARAAEEAQMTTTRNFVLGGSPTARSQEEGKALTGMGELIYDAVSGNKIGVFGKLLRAIGYGDVSDETLEELSKLLLTRQTPKVVTSMGQRSVTALPGPVSATTQATTAGTAG